ncbi:hypothetical protein RHMOL_Rhmol05G0204000 [Rhododendron molle]|uniref:Uncharacterized protein n=1 Tax=Rhododendron molle TaxID=49168 RepID=A0ACC0NRE2_RHOML|nr:hypothetical protein RHMOL_Rhmol05G0204000 [Rhododendron molle]
MGACCSDVRGGQEAMGGAQQQRSIAAGGGGGGGEGHNDAVEFFYRTKGVEPLFTQIELSLIASKLLDRDIISKSDPMAIIYAKKRDGSLEELGRTEVIMNCLDPAWIEKINVAYQFEIVQPLIFHVYDVDTSYHNLPVKVLIQSRGIKPSDFHEDEKVVFDSKIQKSIVDLEKLHKEKIGANFILPSSRHHTHEKVLKGKLFVDRFIETKLYSFLDYMSSGFELNFMVAVDFTASNGNPHSRDSLHYIDPTGRLNAYQQAIMEVGEVIQFYDSDRRFPAWGFGGRTYDGSLSHCFDLNGSAGSFEVEGVEGIMAAYASALHNVTLAGPTLFGQVINTAADIAGHSVSSTNSKYFVLLIITDGVLTDLQETKNALVRASDLPLSVLIVGVGGADFTQMEILDADNGQRLESSTGRIATRDIVQFVPMREVHGGQISIVQALLEELSGQFLTYMRTREIIPQPVTVPATAPPQDHSYVV